MPLFSHRNPEPATQPPPPAPEPTQGRSGSIFRRSREEPAPPPAPPQQNPNNSHFGSIFGRRSSVERDNASIASTNSGSVLHRGRISPPNQDPSIRSARQKVSDAERAERAADEALLSARSAVREARDHVKFLEREAEAEAARARARQSVVQDVSKSARGLGRHGA